MPLDAAVERGDVRTYALGAEQHVSSVLEEGHTGWRGLDAAAAANEERRAQLALKLSDALADRRRLDVLLLGGELDVRAVANADEESERLQVEVLQRSPRLGSEIPERNP